MSIDEHRQLTRPDLIVLLGYGDELPVYQRARAVWGFYASHLPGIEFVFFRESPKLRPGEVVHDGYDLLIGTGIGTGEGTAANYASTGRWAANENRQQIKRQVVLYDYLLRTRPGPFFLYQVSVTSAVDFRGLSAALDRLPTSGCYAGMPGRLSAPPQVAGLTICSGANNLFTRDVVSLMRDRYADDQPSTHFPNDVWQALTLLDVPRIPLPHFSFTNARHPGELADVPDCVRGLMGLGHYHFRIKTTSQEAGLGRREDVDPWLQLKIMETLLATPFPTAATGRLLDDLARFSRANPDGRIDPVNTQPIYDEAVRTFPITEADLPGLAARFPG